MKTIEKIDITFSNCEGFSVTYDCFDIFFIPQQYESFNMVGGRIEKIKNIDDFLFVFNSKADVSSEGLYQSDTIFSRLSLLNDISNLTVKYSTGEIEYISVNWFPSNQEVSELDYFYSMENSSQQAFIINDKIIISCGEDRNKMIKFLKNNTLTNLKKIGKVQI